MKKKKKEKPFLRLFQMKRKRTKYGNWISEYRINGVIAHGITKVSIDDNSDSPLSPTRVTITFECDDIRIKNTKAPLESGADA